MINKTFRLFISSTFSDFIIERNLLNDVVSMIVGEYCESRGYSFQIIDLRWGVNAESAINQNTIEICLNEVRRCKEFSPKPNFLLMVGERYGWVPIPDRLASSVFEALIDNAEDNEISLLKEWYILDENDLEKKLFLRKREHEYVDDVVWSRKEKEIQKVLIRLVKESNLEKNVLDDILTSATEKEIIEGLLGEEDVCDNTICFFREGYPEKDSDLTRINKLKQKITDRVAEDGCNNNIISLEYDNADAYKEVFAERISEVLVNNIKQEIDRIEEASVDLSKLELLKNTYIEPVFFKGREPDLKRLCEYVNSETNKPLFLKGESGSGKTTLLAEMVTRYSDTTIFGFYGLDEHSYSLLEIIEQIVDEITEKCNSRIQLQVTDLNLTECFRDAIFSAEGDNRIVIVIDGLDMFQDINDIKESVFPRNLPSNVKLIVSGADDEILDSFLDDSFQVISLNSLSRSDSFDSIMSLLKSKGRCISNPEQKAVVTSAIQNGKTPLEIKLIASICAKWKSSEENTLLSSSKTGLANQYLETMFTICGHEKKLCLYVFALILSSPFGITEREIQDLLLKFDSVQKAFSEEDRYSHDSNRLPFVVWSRLFHDLQDCASLSVSYGNIVVIFIHSIFSTSFLETYPSICENVKKTLVDYYSSQDNYLGDSELPNTRKARVLPYLLRTESRKDLVAKIYADGGFADAITKIGNIDGLISDYRLLYDQKLFGEESDFLKKIINCLQRNRELLSCYTDRLEQCYCDYSIINDRKLAITQVVNNAVSTTSIRNYPATAKIRFNKMGNVMAVISKGYTYIFDISSQSEICRIYTDSPYGARGTEIKDVLWIGSFKIATVTSARMYIYEFEDMRPNMVKMIIHDGGRVYYDEKRECLYYQEKPDVIISYDIQNDIIKYRISGKCIFTYDNLNDQIAQLLDNGELRLLSPDNGVLKSSFSLKTKAYPNITFTDGLYPISQGKWLLQYSAGGLNYLFDQVQMEGYLIELPFSTSSFLSEFKSNCIVGNKFLIYKVGASFVVVDLNNSLEMSYICSQDAIEFDWVEIDKTVVVNSTSGIHIISIEDAKSIPEELQFATSRRRLSSVTWCANAVDAIGEWLPLWMKLKKSERANHLYDYDTLFLNVQREKTASIVEYSNSGMVAVAHEEENLIKVFDQDEEEILIIDNLDLSVVNNILKIKFSPDSRKLLLWRNYSVQVISIAEKKCIVDINIMRRPAFDVSFSSNSSELIIFLCNEKHYFYDIERKRWKESPPKTIPSMSPNNNSCFVGPYTVVPDPGGNWTVLDIVKTLDRRIPTTKWFDNIRGYWSGRKYLLFAEDNFYYNNSYVGEFKNSFMDFRKSIQMERRKDSSEGGTFLREKNDIMSSLYEISDGEYLILVSRLLNSVLLFNVTNLSIVTAHKVHATIIGDRFLDDETLEVICNQKPYRVHFRINYMDDKDKNIEIEDDL